jgi:geranylgeranyl transferase type-2 subunit beta
MNQILDALLRQGTQSLSSGLRDRIADYIISRRLADGGYPGRSGDSDPYYTDFALRILSQTRSDEVRHPATCTYAQWSREIIDIPECLNRISIANLCDVPLPQMAGACLDRHRLPSGCFARSADSSIPSAYCTFLGAICEDMLGAAHQISKDSLDAILKLQQPGGGFTDTGSDESPQTNPTSAAVSYLLRALLLESPITGDEEAELESKMNRASDYLIRMHGRDGGFLAHAKAVYPDLLSTFTALATLIAMDRIDPVDLKKHIRFVGSLADAGGGFRSCAIDSEPDIEYTYYGLGCLSLFAVIVGGKP